jgi:uncharacterized YigZ family protein
MRDVPTSFLTLAAGLTAAAETEVKRSRFIAVVRRVADEAEARDLVADQRKAHHAARHHCSAMVLGAGGLLERSSDDGEPAGTAGAPMLEVLRGHQLGDVAAVVTRYFGGTLLGSGGLARAYAGAVTAALLDAPLVRRVEVSLHRIGVPLADLARVESALRDAGYAIDDVSYGADSGQLVVGADDPTAVADLVARLTKAAPDVEMAGTIWVDRPAG